MIRKVMLGLLSLAMIGGFAVGAFYIGRDILMGPRTSERQNGGAVRLSGTAVHETWARGGGGLGSAGGQRGAATESRGLGAGGQGRVAEGKEPLTREVAWREIEGLVAEYDGEMIVETETGPVMVGMGQSAYIQGQNFQARPGDHVIVRGFDEDGEFKAGEVRNLSSGQTLVLRDQDGRPVWAGNGNGRNRS